MPPKRILLVDDDADIRKIAQLGLERVGGYEVIVASSAKEALQLAEEMNPDLVLSDVMMPEMDGVGLMTELRDNPVTNHLKVVFLTAKAQRSEQEQLLSCGALGVISKPFKAQSLVDQLRKLVS
jgi:CheY-like chemotaxis protein